VSEGRSTIIHASSHSFRETIELNPNDHLPEMDDGMPTKQLSLQDLFVKDAFLVFRALCKLTMKPLNTERSVSFHIPIFY
jgi:brefeldin A-inhibited guanine nucleotide-exchange protein